MSIEETIKGLECCEGANGLIHCMECPYKKECADCELAQGEPLPLLRDALEWLKKLAKCNHDCKIDCLLDAYNRVVAERDALKKGSGEWISVKDRLPEKSGWYLICDATDPIGSVVMEEYRASVDRWGMVGNEVTHWMPLPEPPKEG